MKFGVREAVDVTFKAIVPEGQTSIKFGSLEFAPFEPVLVFDTLKTTTSEQAVTTVYAQGGRGNPKIVGWDGDKTLTLTMEDAVISKEGLAILMNAQLVASAEATPTYEHVTKVFSKNDFSKNGTNQLVLNASKDFTNGGYKEGMFAISDDFSKSFGSCTGYEDSKFTFTGTVEVDKDNHPKEDIRIDYYIKEIEGKTVSINIDKGEFKGINFYVEGDTLFRDTDGKDHSAQLIYPRVKVQSNMNFSLSGTGDPTTFTFTCDAFPGKIKGQQAVNKKLLGAIQIFED